VFSQELLVSLVLLCTLVRLALSPPLSSCDGLYRTKCDRGGPIHLTIGTAGAHLNDANIGIFNNSWTSKVILQTYGYGRITVKNESALHFEFVKAGSKGYPIAGNVLDGVWITRAR
jgi:Iron/zinc purple acid phosphatase-like protein C